MTQFFGPVGQNGGMRVTADEYPDGATPVTASSGDIAAGTAAAALPAVAGKTNYITGFTVTGSGATVGAVVAVTVVGGISGTMTFTYTAIAGAVLSNQPLIVSFPYPIPASAVNTAITVSCPTLGTGAAHNTVNAFGYVK